MEKLRIIRGDDLSVLKNGIETYRTAFLDSDNLQLIELFGKDPFVDSKFSVEKFSLDMSAKAPFDTEFVNVKTTYEKLKFLTRSQASDERLWAGLCLTEFWNYTKYRWKVDENNSADNILSHFFFNYSRKRSLTRNAMARLWWIGCLTYNKDNANPYELTELVCRNANFILDSLERNTSNNPAVVQSFLKGVLRAEKEGYELTKKSFSKLAVYMNLLGGTYLLDAVPSMIIEEKIYDYAMKVVQQNGY
ncbi:DUF6339 family protein [Enterococcus gilvus]|uniref:DUF6339 family protein n=1 Tax=Enterococcus gilvus TaxID=160453 RepID=UPI003D6BFC1C